MITLSNSPERGRKQDRSIAGMTTRVWGKHASLWIIRVAFIAFVVGVWQIASTEQWVNPAFVGKPTVIIVDFLQLFSSPVVLIDLPTTLAETFFGFAIGGLLGLLLGALFVRYDLLYTALQPILSALNSLPRIALAPVFIIWFGIGMASKVALSISLVVFIVLLNTVAALTERDRDIALLAKSLGATSRQRLMKFVLPGAVPMLVAGLQLGLVYSFLGAIAGELMGGSHGLGVQLAYEANTFHTNRFFAILLLLAIVTSLVSAAMTAIERRLLRWHHVEMKGM